MMKRLHWLMPALLLFGLTACSYRTDRFDEYVVTMQSDQFNLYRNDKPAGLDDLARPEKTPVCPENQETAVLAGNRIELGAGSGSYAVVAILSGRTPPVVQGYSDRVGKSGRDVLFSVPLDCGNAILLRREDNGDRIYQILLSLRYDTLIPIVRKNNYELFILTLRHCEKRDEWEITEFKNVTDGENDAVQGVFSPDGSRIAFVEDDRKNTATLVIMNRDGTDRRTVSANGLLPCFLASGELLFVEQSGVFRDFRVYVPGDGAIRRATDAEIAGVLRTVPSSGLREFYRRFESGGTAAPLPAALPERSETLRTLFIYGLRNSPVILQSYYDYLSLKARNTQNLFDIGPDFFMGADYLLTSNIFWDTPNNSYYVIGDRIGNDNFIRFMSGFAIPVIPNLPLRWAQRYHDNWTERYGRASILKAFNEFSGRLPRLVFDCRQAASEIDSIDRQLRRNAKRIERFQKQLASGVGTAERVIFAENIQAGLQSDRNSAAERLRQCQLDLAALIGLNPDCELVVQREPDDLERLEPLHGRRSREWFLAQGRINRQELHQIDALVQQDAATRDMGPERTRIDAVRVSISYGLGFLEWRKLVDDFLLMGVSYAVPMRMPIFFDAYYQDYDARIMALRMRKYQMDGAIQGEIASAWGDYSTENGRNIHRAKRGETLREQARIANLLQKFGTRDLMSSAPDYDEYTAEVDSIAEQMVGDGIKYERLRRLAYLYQAAGRADIFLREAVTALETAAPRSAGNVVENRGVYLWLAPDIIRSKSARDAFFERCGAGGIGLVYCYFSMEKDRIPFLKKYEPEYAFFLEGCRRRNIRVMALIGEPEWVDPARRGDMFTLLDAYNEFNGMRAEIGEKGFDGLSIDVEPHSEPGWNNGSRNRLILDYLDMLDAIGGKIGKNNLNAAVPYTYSGVPVLGSYFDLLKETADRCGSLTLMAYRDTVDGVLKKAEPILARGNLDCPVFVAVETNPVSEAGVSFAGTPRTEFLSALEKCAEVCSKYKNFSGMVVHDDAGFSSMR